jgi:hypothetical protein
MAISLAFAHHGCSEGRHEHCKGTWGTRNARLWTACCAFALLLALMGMSETRSSKFKGEGICTVMSAGERERE